MPIDKLIKANWIARKAHESIGGIKLGESMSHLTVKCRITLAGVSTLYGESYAKDGTCTGSRLRRDLKAGRASFRAYYLSGTSGAQSLILVMETYDFFGTHDYYGEELVELVDPDTIRFNQYCQEMKSSAFASQLFYGKRAPFGGDFVKV
jgi:hypothetical protein